MNAAAPVVLEASNIGKRYPGVQALDGVSLTVRRGEVIGLVGENGAGKSTLLSILSGSEQPDMGEIRVHGGEPGLASYAEANRRGVYRAHQDQGLLANMTVAENLFIGHESKFTALGILRPRRMRAAARRYLASDATMGGGLEATAMVADLPLDQRQLVEITRAFAVADVLDVEHPIVLLDETTASLNQDEVADLFRYVRRHRGNASFLFVSHRLDEILDICDRVYVIKDGRPVAERQVDQTDEAELHTLMVGRERLHNHYLEDRKRSEFGSRTLRVRGLTAKPHFADVSISVCEGEIVGIGGLTGCGKSSFAQALSGDTSADGEVCVGDVRLRSGRPTARVGLLAYGPLDRHDEGVSLLQSIRWNTTWSSMPQFTRGPLLRIQRERQIVATAMKRYRIAAPGMETLVGSLSGGNQQKVMLARLVSSGAKVLVLDNPTRGVDVGARQEIYAQLRDLAEQGLAIVMITDDLRELIGMSDRIVAMKDGRVVHEWDQEAARGLEEEDIVARMV